jgi:hypothetical protein
MHLAEQHRRGDGELAAGFGRASAQGRFGIGDGRQQLPAAFDVLTAFFGERVASGGAIEQPDAQMSFQRRQGTHDGRG